MQACRIGRPRAAGSPQFPHATPRQPRAISPRIAPEIWRQDALDKREGAGKAGRWPHPWLHAKKHAVVTTGSAETTLGLKRSSQHRFVFFSSMTATGQAPPL